MTENMATIKITGLRDTTVEVPKGTSLLELSRQFQPAYSSPIVAAIVDNHIRELSYSLNQDCQVEWLDLSTEDGLRVYRRSLSFVLIKACRDLFPDGCLNIHHSLGNGLYCELRRDYPTDEAVVRRIEAQMREIVAADLPFIKQTLPKQTAIELFEREGQPDKARLLKYREVDTVNVYSLAGLHDYFYGHMVPSTGYLQKFALLFYPPGMILQTPEKENPNKVRPYVEQPKLSKVFREAEQWADILEVTDVGALNDVIAAGKIGELIRIAEALHEKKLAQIADEITAREAQLRLILIAGPSSSGKTTFAQRLSIQLRVNGLRPVSISLDDYFVNRELTPKDENGNYDFEALDAIDIPLFNQQLTKLIQGEEVELPVYNFRTGRREYNGRRIRISSKQPIIIEGIHGLNDRLTEAISRDNKFKIYVSALTQLNIDSHNRIPTTDTRIIRRIVRDHQFRGHSALKTIWQWPSVRRGEERNIFPFQEEADVMFNSSLIYELAVLRKYAEPLLREIEPTVPEFVEARRLLKFLSYFLPVSDEEVPSNSILREFIGGSCFYQV